jgi:formate hydrogenlyase subunit 4
MIQLLNYLLIIGVAMVIPGLVNRIRAILAGKRGPRWTQHLHNTALLLRKGAVYSTTTSVLFQTAPAIYLAAILTAALFIPVGELPAVFTFRGDMVCFIYLLGLSRATIILAAMDTGSSFEGMGASREALYGALIEPALLLGIATLALISGYTSFSDIFGAEAPLELRYLVVTVLLCYLFVKIFFVEQGRVPVDDPRTHLELTMIHEVMCLDYCGVDLAFIQIANWVKGATIAVIAANTLLLSWAEHWWAVFVLSIVLSGGAVGIVESTQARNKLSRNTTFILTIVALTALVFFVALLLQSNIEIR